jgi:hypothetical protein
MSYSSSKTTFKQANHFSPGKVQFKPTSVQQQKKLIISKLINFIFSDDLSIALAIRHFRAKEKSLKTLLQEFLTK